MKKIIYTLISIALSIDLFAQKQIYNGNYKLAIENTNGIARYSYKEIDDERVKDRKTRPHTDNF